MDKIRLKKINNKKESIFNSKFSYLIKNMNINNIQRIIFKKYEIKSIEVNKNIRYRNIDNIPINKTSDNIYLSKFQNWYINKKRNQNSNNNKDSSYQYTICDYENISTDELNNKNKGHKNNYYKYNNKTFVNNNGKHPVIMISKKNDKKLYDKTYEYKIKKNDTRNKIIKIQSVWRGHFLRKIAIGSIKKYIGFIALIKYINNIYIKKMKILFFIKLNNNKKNYLVINRINFNNQIINTSYEPKYLKKIKTKIHQINNRYEKDNTNLILNKSDILKKRKQKNEKNNNLINISNYNNNNKKLEKFIYMPKKISIYKLEKNKYSLKNSINTKLKIKNFFKCLNKICYHENYPIFSYKLRIIQKINLLNSKLKKLKNIIYLIDKIKLRKFLKKYRDYTIYQKAIDEIYKPENINSKFYSQIKNGNTNKHLLELLINKKIDLENKNNKILMKKYFGLWLNQNNHNLFFLLKKNSCPKTDRNYKKKYLKIKYSHDISFFTETSKSGKKNESKDSILNKSHKKTMKVKNILIRINKGENILSSSLDLGTKNIKMKNIINKINNKKILTCFFSYWKKSE